MTFVVEFMLVPKPRVARQNPGFLEYSLVIRVIPWAVDIFAPRSTVLGVVTRELRIKTAVKIDRVQGIRCPRSVEEQPGLVFSKPSDRMRGICGRKPSRIVVNG